MTRLLLVLALIVRPALAAPPPGTDLTSPIHAWFERQHNMRGGLCCDIADGHVLDPDEWRATASAYEVKIKGVWRAIPDEALRDPAGGPNPTGKAVAWYTETIEGAVLIWCFAPGAQL